MKPKPGDKFRVQLAELRGDWIKAGIEGDLLTGVIHGVLASKSNSRKIVRFGGHMRIIKEQAALDFLQRFECAAATVRLPGPMEGPFTIEVKVYQPDLRRDLDIELLCDALQKYGLIKNDRAIWQKFSRRLIDSAKPRVTFRVKSLDPVYWKVWATGIDT